MLTGLVGLVVPLPLTLLGVLVVLRCPSDQVLRLAAIAAVVIAVLSPSFVADPTVIAVSIAGTVLVLGVALIRARARVGRVRARIPVALLALAVWGTAAGSAGYGPKFLAASVGTLVLVLLLAVVLAADPLGRERILLPLAPIVLIVESAYGILEEFGVPGLWPLSNGRDVIANRFNAMLPILPGRPIGTTGQPITFGILLAFLVFVCAWYAVAQRRRWLWCAVGIGVVGLAVSGTRSAVIALFVALFVWLVQPARWSRWRVALVSTVAAAGVVAAGTYLAYAFASGLALTSSFAHRFGVLGRLDVIIARPIDQVVVGTGFNSIHVLLYHRLLTSPGETPDHVKVFDEEFVRVFVGTGLVGVALLLATIVVATVHADRLQRCLLLLLVSSFLFYDTLSWRIFATLFVVVVVPRASAAVEGRRATRRGSGRHVGSGPEDGGRIDGAANLDPAGAPVR